jgi:hypothetical protein
MPLQKQTVDIPLGVGVDTITDPKQVQPGKLALVENGIFEKSGLLQQRLGLTSIVRTILSGGSLTAGRNIASFNDELVLLGSDQLYGYSTATGSYIGRGPSTLASVKSRLIDRPAAIDYTSFSYAQGNGIEVVVARTSPDTYAWAFDSATGEVLVSKTLITSNINASVFTVVFAAGKFFLYETISTVVQVRILDTAALASGWGSPATVFTGSGSAQAISAKVAGGAIYLAFAFSGSRNLSLAVCSATTGLVTTGPTTVETTAVGTVTSTIDLHVNANGNADDAIYIIYGTSSTLPAYTLRARTYDLSLNALSAAQTLEANALNGVAGFLTATSVEILYWREVSSTIISFLKDTRRITLTRTGTIGTPTTVLSNCTPVSTIASLGGSNYLIVSENEVNNSQLPSYHLIRLGSRGALSMPYGEVVTSFSSFEAAGGLDTRISQLLALSSTELGTCLGRAGRVQSATTLGIDVAIGPQISRITLSESAPVITASLGRSLFYGGSNVSVYSGLAPVELNFRTTPDACVLTDAGTGPMSAGSYQYLALYEWTDSQGQIHRSAPSIARSIGLVGGRAVQVTFRTPLFTSKPDVSLVVYRTVADGTTFYQQSRRAIANPAAAVATFTDLTSDSTLQTREILYTTGGVLESIPVPPCKFVFTYRNRLVACDLEDDRQVWVSREYVAGEVPYFSDAITLRVDSDPGPVIAGGVVDDKAILFKRNSIYVFAGQGPTDTGAQNDYFAPQLLFDSIGCVDPASVVRVPMGVIFRSDKGYMLLDRGLNLSYIGAAVKDYENLECVASYVETGENAVRFVLRSGPCLVYQINFEQWSVLTNWSGQSGCMWRGQPAVLSSDGVVRYELAGNFLDAGVNVPLKLVTPWLRSESLQGFQRIYEAAFLGSNLSGHTFQVRVGYDYEDTYSETMTLASSAFTTSVEQVKVRPARQKCQAIRFEVTKLNPSNTAGPGINLSGMAITVGVKGNINRTRVQQVAT